MKIIICLLLSFVMLLFASVLTVAANDSGYYFRLNYLNNDISGDFDATRYYTYGLITGYVPVFDPADGFGLTLGGYRGKLSGEVNYYFSQHNAIFIDLSSVIHQTTMFYDILSFDLKYTIFNTPQDRFSFFVMTGIGFPRFNIKDATESSGNWVDLTYQGIAYNIGAGCSLRFNKKISFDVNYVWRRIEISEATTAGYHNLKPIDDTFLAPNRLVLIGISYHF